MTLQLDFDVYGRSLGVHCCRFRRSGLFPKRPQCVSLLAECSQPRTPIQISASVCLSVLVKPGTYFGTPSTAVALSRHFHSLE